METNLKSNSQDTQVRVLMINDKGIMLSVKGNDYFISYNRIPWMKNACISDALDGAKLNGDAIKINEYIVAICIAVIILCTGYPVGKTIKKIKRHLVQNTPS